MCTIWLLIGIITGVYIDQIFTISSLETYLDSFKDYIDTLRKQHLVGQKFKTRNEGKVE